MPLIDENGAAFRAGSEGAERVSTDVARTAGWCLLLLLATLLPLTTASAQRPAHADAIDEMVQLYGERFDAVAARHRAELHDLVRTRGMRTPGLPEANLRGVMSVLGERPRQTLLVYQFRGDTLDAWALDSRAVVLGSTSVSPDGLAEWHQALRASWGVDALQAIRASAQRGFESAEGAADTAEAALLVDQISAALFPKPVREFLTDRVEALEESGMLPVFVVVPAHGIGTIPFSALEPFRSEELLVDRAGVVIAPSLHDIGRVIDDCASCYGGSEPLVVGNPEFPPGTLAPLPGAEREAKTVAALLGTTPLLGADATKATLIENASGRPLLYFATHAVSDVNDALDGSYLALAGGAEDDVARWTAREIQHADLGGTGLVVLSACQTGLGQVHDAGMIGLARAFQLAGVPQVVMSLWSVNDQATADLMEAFMRFLVGERRVATSPDAVAAVVSPGDVAAALRAAMLETRQRWQSPADWASSTVFGAAPPLAGLSRAVPARPGR